MLHVLTCHILMKQDCSSTNGSRHVAPVGRSCRSSKDFETEVAARHGQEEM